MKKKLVKHGDQLALILDAPIIQALGNKKIDELEIIAFDGGIIIKAVSGPSSMLSAEEAEALERRTRKTIEEHRELFEKLAKT